MAAALKRFTFQEPGSRILREFSREQQLARALKQRQALQVRQFAGAAVNRLTLSFGSSSRSINADLDSALEILRSRARNLCANYEYGRKFLSLCAANIVGPLGPTLQVRASLDGGRAKTKAELDKAANSAIEYHFARWSQVCDVRGQQTFAQLLQTAVKAVARDGEAPIRIVRQRDLPYGIGLQLLEADRVDHTLNRLLDNGNIVRQGVECNSFLRPVAYWLLKQHPGENFNQLNPADKWERVPARDMYLLFRPERAEQVRGYSWLHAVLIRAGHMQGFEEAAVVNARVGASKMGFFKRTGDPTSDTALKTIADGIGPKGELQVDAEPGEFVELPVGYDFVAFNPDYPHELFAEFVRSCLQGFASGTDTDYASLSNDRTGENYSSIRHGKLESNEAWMLGQEWLASMFLLPFVRTDWLPSALIRGDITFPATGNSLPAEKLTKFADASRFQGRRWPWVDPLKDAQAATTEISAGLTSRTRICAAQGLDFEDVVDELAQEKKLLEAAGLPWQLSTGAKPAAGDSADAAGAGAGDAGDGTQTPKKPAAKK